jgi:antagonist of KipI
VALIIHKPGVFTSVQDLGRYGSRSLGINPTGVMDTAAARITNTLLGNADSDALLEMHFPAPEIEFDRQTSFSIGGADLGAELDGRAIRNWTTANAEKGSRLRFTGRESGTRAYLAVKHGIRVREWLGSASTNLMAGAGGVAGRRLVSGDVLECDESNLSCSLEAGRSLVPHYSRFPTVRIVAGPEFDLLTAISERAFLNDGFTLTNDCNRMGYRLDGVRLSLLHRFELVSSPVTFGTIQLLPDGQTIILMADHQTTGGYPRIGNVISVDLPLLAQCGPGDGVSFKLVTTAEAEAASARFERELNFMRVGCRLQTRC